MIAKKVVLGVALALGVSLGLANSVHAAISLAPDPARLDPADTAVGNVISLVVSLQAQARVPQTSIKVYSGTLNQNVALRIHDYNMCYTPGVTYGFDNAYNNFDQQESYSVMDSQLGAVATTFDSTGFGPVYGRVNKTAGCKNQFLNYNVITNIYDPDSRLYYGQLNVTAASGNAALLGNEILNMFRVQCLTAGCMIGYDAGNSPDRFGIQQSRHSRTVSSYFANDTDPVVRSQSFSSYDVPFAPPCSMATPQLASMRFLDLDYANARVQPYRMFSTIYDDTAGAVVNFSSIRRSGTATPVPFSRLADGRYNIEGPTGVEVTANFMAQPGHKYRLMMDGVFYNNTLRIQLPYDSINAVVNCQADISRNLIMNPTDPTTIVAGDNIDLRYEVTNSAAFAGLINYDYIEFKEQNGVNGYGVGDAIIASGTVNNVNVPPGGPLVVRANSRIASLGTTGNRFCAAFRIAAANASTNITTPGFILRCVSIGKTPYLRATNGDIWAGGSFGGSCSLPGTRYVQGSNFSYGAVTYGSYNNLAVGSAGPIDTFGSNRAVIGPPSTGLTFANTPTLGQFTSSSKCLSNPFAVYQPLLTTSGAASPNITVPVGGSTLIDYTASGSRNLSAAGALAKGTRKIYHVNGTVRITGSGIVYDDGGGYANMGELQQFVLLAEGDIIIDPSVTRLDGVYAAKGDIITCGGISAPSDLALGSACGQQLRVNGMVVAGQDTKAYRFFGASNEPGMTFADPAEIFDLNPAQPLGEYSRTAGSASIKVIDQREAPPRF